MSGSFSIWYAEKSIWSTGNALRINETAINNEIMDIINNLLLDIVIAIVSFILAHFILSIYCGGYLDFYHKPRTDYDEKSLEPVSKLQVKKATTRWPERGSVAAAGMAFHHSGCLIPDLLTKKEIIALFLLGESSQNTAIRTSLERGKVPWSSTFIGWIWTHDVPEIFSGTGEIDKTCLYTQWRTEHKIVRNAGTWKGTGIKKTTGFWYHNRTVCDEVGNDIAAGPLYK